MASAPHQFRPVPTEGAETHRSLDEDNIGLSELASTSMLEEIVGSSDAISRVTDQILRVAPSDATVLITGESGTGHSQEVKPFAQALDLYELRCYSPFAGCGRTVRS